MPKNATAVRRLTTAKLIKLRTLDGLFEVEDHVQLGKEYTVDLASITVGEGINLEVGVRWSREIIYMEEGDWFPTELLEIEGREVYENSNCL